MKKKMDLVSMTLENTTTRFTRKEVRENLGNMLRETEKLDNKLFLKFWKEIFPKVTLSLKQTEFILNFYESSDNFPYNMGNTIVEMMDEHHRNYKLTDDQKWYYGVYMDD